MYMYNIYLVCIESGCCAQGPTDLLSSSRLFFLALSAETCHGARAFDDGNEMFLANTHSLIAPDRMSLGLISPN